MYALAAADGRERWRVETIGGVRSSPAVADGTVYVGNANGNVSAVAAADGSERWRFRTDRVVQSSPAVADGTVYVGSDDGRVYALGEGDRSVGSGGVVVPGTEVHLWLLEAALMAVGMIVGAGALAAGRRHRPKALYLGVFLATVCLSNAVLSIVSVVPTTSLPATARHYSSLYLLAVLGPSIGGVVMAGVGRWLVGKWRGRDGESSSAADQAAGSDSASDSDDHGACPSCGRSLDGGETFCPGCGHELTDERCPECASELEGFERFCPACGADLS